ncbi:hypothetical protein PVL29_007506 [Vitis rotundifolia]|uniref:Uncharacterized protein n=1 Tax=Vitis rotundifolia TaxID=103349 RepID=A0AA39DWA5_VITRO|nr:hypothetical protein PVL29_007506 [Vitis rotundifolia]
MAKRQMSLTEDFVEGFLSSLEGQTIMQHVCLFLNVVFHEHPVYVLETSIEDAPFLCGSLFQSQPCRLSSITRLRIVWMGRRVHETGTEVQEEIKKGKKFNCILSLVSEKTEGKKKNILSLCYTI